MGVDWNAVTSGNYVQIEEGKPKTLVLTSWKEQDRFKDEKTHEIRPGVEFKVSEEDGVPTPEGLDKTWTVTAKGALILLKPICQKAETEGKTQIKVSVVAVGKGTSRKYSISEAA